MQLLDRSGVKSLANAIIKKISNGLTITGDFIINKKLSVGSMSHLKKGLAGTYVRFLDPRASDEEAFRKFMYMNYDGVMWRLCCGTDLTPTGTFTSVEEVMTADYDAGGYIRLDRNTIPEKNGVHNLGSKNWRWSTLYCVNALNTSSKEYKSNIEYIQKGSMDDNGVETADILNEDRITTTDMYSFVKNIPLASFDYAVGKEAEKEDRALGFIAEDIMDSKVGKAFVFDTEDGAMFNPVSYVSVLYGATQELMARVEYLESQLASKKEA